MNPRILLLAALIAAPLISAPALAQPAPPPPPAAMAGPHGHGMAMGARMFPSMSEAGRQAMQDAMQAGGNRRDDRQKMEAVRDKLLNVVAAERLDIAAVKRVMDEERALADATRQQRQTAMLAALQKLSPQDRQACVTDSRAMKSRMHQRMDGWRGRMKDRMRDRMSDGISRGGEPRPPAPPMEG